MMRNTTGGTVLSLALLAGCQTAPEPVPAPEPVAEAAAPVPDIPWREVDAEDLVILKTRTGEVVIELAADAAPEHVASFREVVRANAYNGEYFYRVIDGHVAQAGLEFEQAVEEWPTVPLEAERTVSADGFTPLGNADLFASPAGHRDGFAAGREGEQEWLLNCPGALGMARDSDPGTGSTEFFIPIGQRRYLDRNYTIFGRVISGMDHINRLKRVDPVSEEEMPAFLDPDTADAALAARADRLADNEILSMGIAADMPEDLRPRWEVMATPGAEWDALKESKRDYSSISAFVVTPPKVLDICSLPVPARPIAGQILTD